MGIVAVRLATAALAAALLAACAGGSGQLAEEDLGAASAGVDTSAPLPDWVSSRLAAAHAEELALLLGTADHAVGPNRITFAVVRADSSIVQSPRARVLVGHEGARAAIEGEAELVPLGPHDHPGEVDPHDHPDVTDLYVTTVDFPSPGVYWLLVEPEGTSTRALGKLDVRSRSLTPAVGSAAIPSDNPTLDDGFAEDITTARPPNTEMLRYSIADSLEAHVPFVVAFATPRFCQTRVCGPTVEVVDEVRRRFEDEDIRFIHVEIFEANDPSRGVNRWVAEWGLPTEPWIFLVDETGIIRAKFEGGVSVAELAAAVRHHLLDGAVRTD